MRSGITRSTWVLWMVAALVLAAGGCGKSDPAEKARMLMKLGDYSRAIDLYNKALQQSPEDVGLLRELANACEQARQFEQADAAYKKIQDLQPGDKELLVKMAGVSISKAVDAVRNEKPQEEVDELWAEARQRVAQAEGAGAPAAMVHEYRGRYHKARQEVDQAAAEYEKAIEADPQYGPALEAAITLYMELSRSRGAEYLEKAQAHAEALEKIDPTNLTAGLNLARLEAMRGRPEATIDRLKKLREAHPQNADVYMNLATSYLAVGKMEEALKSADEALKRNRNMALPYYVRGMYYLSRNQKGDAATAESEFLRIANLEGNPNLKADVHARIGLCRVRQDHKEMAKQAFEIAIRLNPRHVEARHNLAQVYRREGNLDDAQAQLEAILQIEQQNRNAMSLLAEVFMAKGDLDRAQQLVARMDAIGGTSDNVGPLVNKSKVALLRRDYVTALQAARQAVKESPKDPVARLTLAQALRASEKFDEAIEQCRQARKLDENSPMPYLLEASALVASEREQEGVNVLKMAIELLPDNPQPYFSLAGLEEKRGNLDEAARLLEQYKEKNPRKTPGVYELARIYLRQGKLQAAIDLWDEAVEQFDDAPQFHANLAVAYQLQGKWAEADKKIRDALRKSKEATRHDQVRAYSFVQANIQLASGDPQAARQTIERVPLPGGRKLPADRLQDHLAMIAFVRQHPDQAEPLAKSLNLAHVCAGSGRFEAASQEYDRAQELLGDAATVPLRMKAATWQAAREPEKAIEAYTQVTERKPEAVSAWNALATIYLAQKQPKKAKEAAEDARRIDPSAIPALLVLAELDLSEGSFDQAIELADRVLTRRAAPPTQGQGAAAWNIKGRALQLKGDPERANEAFKQMMVLNPDSASARLGQARLRLSEGAFAAAEALASETLRLRECDPDALIVRAQARLRVHPDQALNDLDMATKCRPDYVLPYIVQSRFLEVMRNARGAERILRQALQQAPDSLVVLYQLGELLRRHERYDDALAEFTALHQAAARREVAAGELMQDFFSYKDEALCYFHLGKRKEALQSARRLVELAPQFVKQYPRKADALLGAHLQLAKLQKGVGDFDQALAELRSTLQLARAQRQVLEDQLDAGEKKLKDLRADPERRHEARKQEDEVRRLKGQLDAVLPYLNQGYELATFYFNKGDYARSAELLKQWQEEFDNDELLSVAIAGRRSLAGREALDATRLARTRAGSLSRLAIAQQLAGDIEAARATARRAMRLDERNLVHRIAAANLLITQKNFDAASDTLKAIPFSIRGKPQEEQQFRHQAEPILSYIEACSKKLPSAPQVATELNVGLFYGMSGWYKQSAASMEKVADTMPENGFILTQLGDMLMKVGEEDAGERARSAYDKALQLAPSYDLYLRAAAAAAKANADKAVLGYYNDALKAFPDNAQLMAYKATQLDALKRHDDALAQYEKILAAPGGDENWTALNNAAWLLATQKQDLKKAMDYADKAQQLAPQRFLASVLDTRGWILYLKGDYPGALSDLERAVDGQPRQPSVRYHLGSVYAKTEGRTRDAVYQLEMALEIDPDFESAKEARALLAQLRTPVADTP